MYYRLKIRRTVTTTYKMKFYYRSVINTICNRALTVTVRGAPPLPWSCVIIEQWRYHCARLAYAKHLAAKVVLSIFFTSFSYPSQPASFDHGCGWYTDTGTYLNYIGTESFTAVFIYHQPAWSTACSTAYCGRQCDTLFPRLTVDGRPP